MGKSWKDDRMRVYLESAIVILIVTTISVSGNIFCGENERFSICGNNECRATCKLPQGPPSCDPKCRPGCICLQGLVRRERDDTCVKIEECFKSPSSRNCLQRRPGCPPKCPHIPQGSGPQCKRRFRPNGNLICGENERFSICGNNECRGTCELPRGKPFCDPKCHPGCICLKGLVRRERDKKCVKLEECYNSPPARNFLRKRPGCPPKKKQIPPKCPHIQQRRGPQCKRRFPQKGRDGVQGPRYFPGTGLEADKKTELETKLRKQYEEVLNKIKDAIEKSEGLKDDLVEKLKEVQDKMKKNNIKIEEKAKDLFKAIKEKAKGAEKKILDKIYGEDNEEGTTSSSF